MFNKIKSAAKAALKNPITYVVLVIGVICAGFIRAKVPFASSLPRVTADGTIEK